MELIGLCRETSWHYHLKTPLRLAATDRGRNLQTLYTICDIMAARVWKSMSAYSVTNSLRHPKYILCMRNQTHGPAINSLAGCECLPRTMLRLELPGLRAMVS